WRCWQDWRGKSRTRVDCDCIARARCAPDSYRERRRYFMALIVIGGHSRRVGKTSVVTGIIAALPEYGWSAFKITQHRHGLGSADAGKEVAWAISEETDRAGGSDTSRFLAAGAEHAFWVRTEPNRLAEAMPPVQLKLPKSKNAIVESNSVLRFLQ